ncbi:MAG: chemotaxis protein CheX [Spirochaetes bacterium]|jgi:CheY-specific phosphatase CheX|nr:chemotaxis protein CheX [Spirochaetota bacterium]
MSNYERYSRFIVRSVDHIFKNFLNDHTIEEVYESQSTEVDRKVAIEIEGTISGELVINLPQKTLGLITRRMVQNDNPRTLKKYYNDVAGELANLISGTFANQMQFLNHELRLSPPEVEEDPITLKTFYENINLSFKSSFGGFDIDLYYKENK